MHYIAYICIRCTKGSCGPDFRQISAILIFQPTTGEGFDFTFFSDSASLSESCFLQVCRDICQVEPSTVSSYRSGEAAWRPLLPPGLSWMFTRASGSVNFSPHCISWVSMVRSFAQRHKNTKLLQVLAKSKVLSTLWGLSERWQVWRLSGEEAACRAVCIFAACHLSLRTVGLFSPTLI